MIQLAWRNLWRNYRRTLIMLLAITVGVWAMIFMTALMRGMVDRMIEDGLDALPGYVQIHHPQFLDDPSIVNSLDPPGSKLLAVLSGSVVEAWTSRVRVPAMISSERNSRGVTLLGVDPGGEIALGFDPDSIVEGRFIESLDDGGVVIGRKLLQRLETRLGKRIVVMSQDPENNLADRGFRIVGVYRANLESQEEAFIYAGRETVQKLLHLDGMVSEVAVTGGDYRSIEDLLTLVKNAAPENAQVLGWQTLEPYLGSMLAVMDGFVLVWVLVIFMALSFGLVNTLMMAVYERIREIGLMQALGMRPGGIVILILLESTWRVMLCLLLGNLLAVASIEPLKSGIDISAVARGMEMMGVGSTLYPALKLQDLIMANAVVIILGLLTSLLPAWHASRYRPVEAIANNQGI